MLKKERAFKFREREKKYTAEEIYNGIAYGRVSRSLGWNVWLGISVTCVVLVWMVVYTSRLLLMSARLKNGDNLVEELKFDEQLTAYGYNVGSLGLSILAFCRMEERPSLLNIPVRLGLSNQIMKQRYMVRNSLERLNEMRYPKSRLEERPVIEGMVRETVELLRELVPLGFMFEDQPSPISPAPPPFYVPYRTNITEEEIKRSVESDSNTFLAAKYLCNNTAYISDLSDSLKFRALNMSDPAKLFDLDYMNKYFKQNDLVKYESTRRMLVFHYVISVLVVIVTLLVFYLGGSHDYFQRRTRTEMMDICKRQVGDILERVLMADEANRKLVQSKFRPVSRVFMNLKSVCDGILADFGKELQGGTSSSLEGLSKAIQEFQSCVDLAQRFSDILANEVGKDSKAVVHEFIRVAEVIERDMSENGITRNNHHFSDNIRDEICLHSGASEFCEVLGSVLNVLGPGVDKAVFWDIIHVGDSSLIPPPMINSIGEVSTNIVQVLESSWNRVSPFKKERRDDYTFLTIDVSPCIVPRDVYGETRTEDKDEMGVLLEALSVITRSFHLLVARRMASCVFGGILISHGNFGAFQMSELQHVGDVSGVTLILPVRRRELGGSSRSSSLARGLSQRGCQDTRIYACGLDNSVSKVVQSISRMLHISYFAVDCWGIRDKEDSTEYLLERPGYWLIDTSVIHLLGGLSGRVLGLLSQSHYLESEIDIILLSTGSGRVEVVSEFKSEIVNLNQFYYSFKCLLSGGTFQAEHISPESSGQRAEAKAGDSHNYGYCRRIVRLLDRPISEVDEDLFRDTGQTSQNLGGESDSLASGSFIELVDVREMLSSQKGDSRRRTQCQREDGDWESEIRRPDILCREWYNMDLLEVSFDELKEIASFLIYYRYKEVIRDKDDYEEDVSSWSICPRKIVNFVSELASRYHEENPFHNFHHAVSISVTLNSWLDKPCTRHYVSSLEAYCLVISSLAHDLDHPGLSNEMVEGLRTASRRIMREYCVTEEECWEHFRGNSLSTLSIYGGFSVLESHHSSLLFAILSDESSNIMPPSDSKLYPGLRKMMINSIILTDMFHHGYLRGLVSGFNERYHSAPGSPEVLELRKKLYLSLLLHSADISNPLMSTNIYLKWSRLIYEEQENQRQLKRMLGIPLNNNTDSSDYVGLQTTFINTICIPYFQALLKFDPELVQDCIQNLYFNREYFVRVGGTS